MAAGAIDRLLDVGIDLILNGAVFGPTTGPCRLLKEYYPTVSIVAFRIT